MIESWTPLWDAVFILAASALVLSVLAVVQLVRMWREARRIEARWQAALDRMWAEASDLYRDDPMGGRTARWDGERR